VLTGSARVAREAEERREEVVRRREERKRELALRASILAVDAKLAALETERNGYKLELQAVKEEDSDRREAITGDQEDLRASREMPVNGPVKERRPNRGEL